MSRSGASQNRVRDRRITGEPHLVHRRFVSASKVNILRPRVRTFRTRGLGQPIPARASPARTDHPCQGLRVGRTRSRCGLFRKLNLKLEQKIDGQILTLWVVLSQVTSCASVSFAEHPRGIGLHLRNNWRASEDLSCLERVQD